MCFSAAASFGASAIIFGIGIECFKKSTTVPQKILSCIPIVFSVQQYAEGVLWLSLSHSSFLYWNKIATYTFLVFAQVVWPIVVPLSIMLLEKHAINKKILAAMLGLGVMVSLFLLYCLVAYKVEATISCSHILYNVSYAASPVHPAVFYFLVTVVSPILSSIKRVRLLGVVILVSYIVTKIFYEDYLISVWCFFAAAISVIVLSVIIKLNNSDPINSGVSAG
jgi:hypothetical protein